MDCVPVEPGERRVLYHIPTRLSNRQKVAVTSWGRGSGPPLEVAAGVGGKPRRYWGKFFTIAAGCCDFAVLSRGVGWQPGPAAATDLQ